MLFGFLAEPRFFLSKVRFFFLGVIARGVEKCFLKSWDKSSLHQGYLYFTTYTPDRSCTPTSLVNDYACGAAAFDRKTSLIKSVSEFVERSEFNQTGYPSTTGVATGIPLFEGIASIKRRARAESIERLVWESWAIDRNVGHMIHRSPNHKFLATIQSIPILENTAPLSISIKNDSEVNVCVTALKTKYGGYVFGSGAAEDFDVSINKSFCEAISHSILYFQAKSTKSPKVDKYISKVIFNGDNGADFKDRISNCGNNRVLIKSLIDEFEDITTERYPFYRTLRHNFKNNRTPQRFSHNDVRLVY